jgi:hypothetical protein
MGKGPKQSILGTLKIAVFRSNPQRQCEYGNGGKARGSCEVADSVADVFH